ncbi:MAG: hypothetical protein KatS3mg029_0526 [Saprospiraceae bacterium]|nr:MAG: hypothetical protein KatS3mg029_0526 [Saprospiraceae bacterium]
MKKLNTLIILLALIAWSTTMVAQRYVAEVFTDVKVTTNVPYGINASIINLLDNDPNNDAHPLGAPVGHGCV